MQAVHTHDLSDCRRLGQSEGSRGHDDCGAQVETAAKVEAAFAPAGRFASPKLFRLARCTVSAQTERVQEPSDDGRSDRVPDQVQGKQRQSDRAQVHKKMVEYRYTLPVAFDHRDPDPPIEHS